MATWPKTIRNSKGDKGALKSWSLSRRAVLKIGVILSGLLSFAGVVEYLSYEEAPETATRITLDVPESYLPGSITPVPQVRAWLLRDESGFYAISGLCTHLGCTVAINDDSNLVCPCHGSAFDFQGAVLNGPAELSLHHVEITYSPDNKLVVNTQVIVPVSQRLAYD
jgi:cytochrome b6-f complex iron-sulfur subunit